MFFGYCDEYVLNMLTDFGVEADFVGLQLPSAVEIVEHEGRAQAVDQGNSPFQKLVTLLQTQVHGQ